MTVGAGEVLRVQEVIELLVRSRELKAGAAFSTTAQKNSI
jgi:hypothetical protein